MEEIIIYKFQLEAIENALRLADNVYNKIGIETCLGRQIKQANRYAKNALEGNKEWNVDY